MIDSFLAAARPGIAKVLSKAVLGNDLSETEVVELLSARDSDLLAVLCAANYSLQETVGAVVTYVVNRNINFTNVCVKHCGFCAFSRSYRSEEGYNLPIEAIVGRAKEAYRFGASEVCIQAGLPPDLQGDFYIRLCRSIKEAIPELSIHAFSPEEILYGSKQSGMTIKEYLQELKDAGLGSLPGTSAEILDDDVRSIISPGRISTSQWVEVISTAHQLGIPTTSTMMYGHVETEHHQARHLLLIRDLQRRTGGFTEFVPLSFVHTEAPMYKHQLIEGVRPGATGTEVLKIHAVARLVLNHDVPNIQASWVKNGIQLAQACLMAGANDLGGTLINESISTAAGARFGQWMRPAELRRAIREAGRIPAERSTLYTVRQRFETKEDDGDKAGALDRLSDSEAERFGSFDQMIHSSEFRFREKAATLMSKGE